MQLALQLLREFLSLRTSAATLRLIESSTSYFLEVPDNVLLLNGLIIVYEQRVVICKHHRVCNLFAFGHELVLKERRALGG